MSSVKEHYEKNGESLICKYCKKSLSANKSGTTTHLWRHLQRKHLLVFQQAKNSSKKKQSMASVEPTVREGPPSKKQALISAVTMEPIDGHTKESYDEAVLNFIASDGQPFEIAAGSGFKKMCSILTSGHYQPSHPTILSQKLQDSVDKLQQRLMNTISSEVTGCRPSITYDYWKADNQANYLVLTIHYVDESTWTMKSRCLSVVNFEKLDVDHTGANTCGLIVGELSKYGLTTNKILFATTNAEKSMTCSARLLGIRWHGCAAHILHLIINAAVEGQENIKVLLSSVHKICGFFHLSSAGQSILTKYQIASGLPDSKPPAGVTTHFSNTYLLLEWVNNNYHSILLALYESEVEQKCARCPPLQLPSEETLKNVLPVLRLTSQATTIFSADTYVSISLIFPYISSLKKALAALSVHGIESFRDELIRKLEDRFDLASDYLLTSTFIDPRFKSALFTNSQLEKVKCYLDNFPDIDQTECVDVSPDWDLVDSVFRDVDAYKEKMPVEEEEFSRYIKEPYLERGGQPLNYWKDNKSSFPQLARVARTLLGVQATNCASERVNSCGGLTDLHHSLSRLSAETLIWAKYNNELLF